MRLPPALGLVLALVAVLVCVRLGFWQLSRLEEKQALNRAQRAALAAPPAAFDAARLAALSADSLGVLRFALAGTLDPRRHVVLVSRARNGEPGVHVVTPLAPATGGALVMVDRGFLPSADGATVRPQDLPEPKESATRTVVGFVERMRAHERPGFLHAIERDTLEIWQAPWLDADSLSAAFGAPVAPLVLHELPGAGVPASPARAAAVKFDEALHLNYAVQWFSFAAIVAIGSIVLLVRSRRPRTEEDSP